MIEVKPERVVTAEVAADLLGRYLAPMREHDWLKLEIELDAVVRLLDPEVGAKGTFQWSVHVDDLKQILEEHFREETSGSYRRDVEIDVYEWDSNDDTGDFTGYRIQIESKLEKVGE